jgi:hypothetical protein
MAERYFIFRMTQKPDSRSRRIYLYPGGSWGSTKAKAMLAGLRKMRALADTLKGRFPDLIIERL